MNKANEQNTLSVPNGPNEPDGFCVELTPEYHEGKKSYFEQMSICPYKSSSGFSNARYRWWMGYFDAKYAKLLEGKYNKKIEVKE